MLIKTKIKTYLLKACYQQDLAIQTDMISMQYTNPSLSCYKIRGDFSTNLAILLSKKKSLKLESLTQKLQQSCLSLDQAETTPILKKIEIVNGFLNFFILENSWKALCQSILTTPSYGIPSTPSQKIIVEHTSINPTGPIHRGGGRIAVVGDTIVRLLRTVGHQVSAAYYVNDKGVQIDTVTTSAWFSYLGLFYHCSFLLPKDAYRGAYIQKVAQFLYDHHHDELYVSKESLDSHLKEPVLSQELLIQTTMTLLGTKYEALKKSITSMILKDIRMDLEEIDVYFDHWFFETQFTEEEIQAVLTQLKERACLYEQEGMLLFPASLFGDAEDRVMVRKNGRYTYFLLDVVFHMRKIQLGYDQLIDVIGADHQQYCIRLKAAIEVLSGYQIRFILVQFVCFLHLGKIESMSKREGKLQMLRDVNRHIGRDATRFHYLAQKIHQSLKFDLDIAQSPSKKNIMHYVQYACARIHSLMSLLEHKNWHWDSKQGEGYQAFLKEEYALLAFLGEYPDVILHVLESFEMHLLVVYLKDLSSYFHHYYDHVRIVAEGDVVRNGRINIVKATERVIHNGLAILGIHAPELM